MSFRVGSSISSAGSLPISVKLTVVDPRAMAISYHLTILSYAVSSVEGDDSVDHRDDHLVHVTIGSSHRSEGLVVPIRLEYIENRLEYIVGYFGYFQA